MPARTTDAQLEAWAKRIGELVRVEKFAPPGQRVPDGEINATTKLAREIGLSRSAVRMHINKMRTKGMDVHWLPPARIALRPALSSAPKARGAGRVVICTSAQDDTDIFEPFWQNLQAYAAHRGADILIGGFTYQKGLFEDHSVASGVFRAPLVPHLAPTPTELAPHLMWHGHRNVLPTAANPLSGWGTVDGSAWSIMPHAKIQMETIPVMPGERPKQGMTTGTLTLPNYVQRAAGQRAEFHHTFGAVVVEIAADGAYWCRQINATKDGSFQDLEWQVHNGRVTAGHRIEGLNPGDLHADDPDVECTRSVLGLCAADAEPVDGSVLAVLRPKFTFLHDSYTFRARSHHAIDDPHEMALLHAAGHVSVRSEIASIAAYVARLRDLADGEVVHIASNHNMHLDRWLKDARAAHDPENAAYWHELNAVWHKAIQGGAGGRWLIHEEAMRAEVPDRLDGVRFVAEGESIQICQGVNPIECGLHSHVGPNGARGSISNLAKLPVRVNIGHSHRPGIKEGAYQAGTLGRRDPAFATKGPTGWLPAHIVTYPNGKRTIITQWPDGRWRL